MKLDIVKKKGGNGPGRGILQGRNCGSRKECVPIMGKVQGGWNIASERMRSERQAKVPSGGAFTGKHFVFLCEVFC